jgi:hypothetical protein
MLPVSKFNSVRGLETRYLQRPFGKLVMPAFGERGNTMRAIFLTIDDPLFVAMPIDIQ